MQTGQNCLIQVDRHVEVTFCFRCFSNCAVCGALLGCKIGYKALPIERLQKMPHIRWLDNYVSRFLDMIDLGETPDEGDDPEN